MEKQNEKVTRFFLEAGIFQVLSLGSDPTERSSIPARPHRACASHPPPPTESPCRRQSESRTRQSRPPSLPLFAQFHLPTRDANNKADDRSVVGRDGFAQTKQRGRTSAAPDPDAVSPSKCPPVPYLTPCSTHAKISKRFSLAEIRPPQGEPPTRMRMAAVLFACGCVFFPTLFHLLRRFLDRTCRDRLSVATTCSISVRCVSSIQAVMACVSGVMIITSCKDIMHDQHPLTEAYAYFGFPYFYYDTWAMFTAHCYNNPHLRHLSTWAAIKHFVLCHKMMMGHHLILPPVFFLVVSVMRQNQGDFFIGCFYLFEIPIPFISAYKILVLLKMQESPLYIITGVAMIIAFTLSRVCIFPYLYWSYGQYRNMAIFDVLFTIPIKCNIGCLVLLFPQLYWLYLMIQGTRKVLSKKMYLTPSGRK